MFEDALPFSGHLCKSHETGFTATFGHFNIFSELLSSAHCPQTATFYFFVCVSLLFMMMYLHINIVFGVQQGFIWH